MWSTKIAKQLPTMPAKAAKAKAAPAKKGGPLVPESVLKKRRKLEEIATAKAAAAKEKETKAAAKEKDTFKRAEKYIVRSRSRAPRDSARARRAPRARLFFGGGSDLTRSLALPAFPRLSLRAPRHLCRRAPARCHRRDRRRAAAVARARARASSCRDRLALAG